MNRNVMQIVQSYVNLTKPRITLFVVMTAALGYAFAGGDWHRMSYWISLLMGVCLSSAGASVLNHYLERDVDGRMKRTQDRPLVTGSIREERALEFGLLLIVSGVMLLWWRINLLTAFLSLAAAFLYVLVYTPMKRVTWLNTTLGAIPGALPPLGGWTAVTNKVEFGGIVLFLILFFWQHPHFYAIAWLCRDDYRNAGLKMLSVYDPNGTRTGRHMLAHGLLLLIISLIPVLFSRQPLGYACLAIIAGWLYVHSAWTFRLKPTHQSAAAVLKTSVIYLPMMMAAGLVGMLF